MKPQLSYSAAVAFPIKIFSDDGFIRRVREHKIPPVHIQWNPTNKCPGKCSFCSCRHRDRTLEIPLEKFKDITTRFKNLGTEACTFTGGGDPLCHPDISEILAFTFGLGIEAGLVTEGAGLDKLDKAVAKNLSWCRISVSDEQPIKEELADHLFPGPEWGLSYVLTEKPKLGNLMEAIEFANKNGMTHIRVATNILAEKPVNMAMAKRLCEESGLNTKLVIWQNRTEYTVGVKRCLLSLMKPNITPDGHMTGCCGSQYMSDPPMLDWPRKTHMHGTIDEIFARQLYYDGSACVRCFYGSYNNVLNSIWDAAKIKHRKFK